MKREDVGTFLKALWGTKEEEDRGWILIWDARFDHASKHLLDQTSTGVRTAEASAKVACHRATLADREIYVGVGLRETKPTGTKRGGTKDVVGVAGFWAEIDIAGEGHEGGKTYPPDEESALSVLEAPGLKPTVLIQSGHGLQAWWLFTDVLFFDKPEERERFAALARNWQATLAEHAKARGWEIDSTADLARVLRVAGTVNHKVKDKPVAVRLLVSDGPRYDDTQPFEERSTAEGAPALSGNVGGPITLDENASPPIERVESLCKANRKFRLSWERRRTDLRDQSASAYCFSLAYHAVEAGWSDQEIVELLVAWRRKHAEPLKLDRPEWYCDYNTTYSTIPKARRSVEQRVAVDVAIQNLTQEDAEVDREGIIDAISRVLGAQVVGFIQHGEEDAIFSFELEGGKIVAIGNSKQLFDVNHCRARIFEKCGAILPDSLKRATWFMVITRLQQIRVHENPDVGERREQLREWVEDYVSNVRAIYSDLGEEGWNAAVEHRLPFVRYDQGFFYLHAEHFWWWLRKYREISVSQQKVWDNLRFFGFIRKTVTGPPTKGYWRYECSEFEQALRVHSGGKFLRTKVSGL